MMINQGIIDYTGAETQQLSFLTYVNPKISSIFFTHTLNKIAVSAQYASSAPVVLHIRIGSQ